MHKVLDIKKVLSASLKVLGGLLLNKLQKVKLYTKWEMEDGVTTSCHLQIIIYIIFLVLIKANGILGDRKNQE